MYFRGVQAQRLGFEEDGAKRKDGVYHVDRPTIELGQGEESVIQSERRWAELVGGTLSDCPLTSAPNLEDARPDTNSKTGRQPSDPR